MTRIRRRTAILSLLTGTLLSPGAGFAASSQDAGPAGLASDPLAYGTVNPALKPLEPAFGERGMVVSAQHLASEAGRQILAAGGNAADAAVAVGYALAVVYPAAGNLGGGGFMTLRLPDGKTRFVDFREHAPGASTPTMYQDAQGRVDQDASVSGWRAVGIPGTVAGLEDIRRHWGRMSRAQVMAPAIALAERGFVLDAGDVALLRTSTEVFRKDPEARRIFLHADGSPLDVGDRLVQKDLAHSLRAIAAGGADAFYKGEIARRIVQSSRKGGGILRLADFAGYRPRELPTLRCSYRGYVVDTAPPPSGGGVALCEMLDILSGYDLGKLGLRSTEGVQRQVEAMRHAYSDRRDLGDPAFVKNPITHLLDPAYAARIREGIPAHHALDSATLRAGVALPVGTGETQAPSREKHETTQFSVADRSGFAVSATYTLNGWFGAGVIGSSTGFFLNDEMDDFSAKPGSPNMFGIVGSRANAIAPGKTPLSSMAPTVVSHDGKPFMVIGSPGGSRIPTIILSVVLGVIDGGLDIQQAIDLPRIHEQWQPSAIELEPRALTPDVMQQLQIEGYALSPHKPWGIAEGILFGRPSAHAPETGGLYGGWDRRHEGGAAIGF
ncbi:gamma-glutamyltranspeptidase [Swaminathania salitolerans LMG 21291]|uniref:Glutathione hydrolase proenzyme n=1 Tax=Swaminathania salitolerans TaxID=182838 RepID=A0A511BN51_9PROT|nr:gamma-glutamyltranspeptidase [Swaminathania salitolerans LMG 21291]GEL01283.1 gamma-glutamyltransferase [Swaminathania salitolerans]